MGRWSEPPFARGTTYFGGATLDLSDLTQIGGEILEGRHYWFDDTLHNSGCEVEVKVCRNMSATPVLPGQLLLPTITATAPGDLVGRVNGVTTGAALFCYIADEILPGTGVPQYDLFYVVVKGPVVVNMPAANPAITAGNLLVSAATGQVGLQDLTGATAALGNNVQNSIGRSMQTVGASAPSPLLLVNADIRW
jgi:hypothetical protein